jgi:peptidyl-dipeptidase A
MYRVLMFLVGLGMLSAVAAADDESKGGDKQCAALVNAYVSQYKPLWIESETAEWEASTTGTSEAFDRKKAADAALVDLHSDHQMFARIQALREGGQVSDPVLRRELDVMYRNFLPGQADPNLQKQIVNLESDVERIFNTHRSRVGDKTLTENEVRAILAETTDSEQARLAWDGYMAVGRKAVPKLRELVRLRNETARQVGFDNYYQMALTLQEIDEAELLKLFDELDEMTREPFARLKQKIDAARAARFGIGASELRPWHFGDLFFQEAPGGQEVDLDELYADADLVKICRTYYASIDLPCDDILARSDLYEKPGKSPHAFSFDLDRVGDIRVLCNLKPNAYWADTLLHELGHGVYDKYIRDDVPFLLHQASHGLTTEGIALMFGAMAKNGEWLARSLDVEPAEAERIGRAADEALQTEKLIFSRWAQVMVRFERDMYDDPDQDLNKLWWDLKKRYQSLNMPQMEGRADYAAKMHILNSPAYYHNYMMGDLFAAQVKHYIARQVLDLDDAGRTSFYDQPKVGQYLREKIFGPGDLYSWNELTRLATGEPLTARYFAERFVE